jgi:hypothetical protein
MQCISENLAFLLRLSARLLKITILVTQQKLWGPAADYTKEIFKISGASRAAI